jgi:CheY-like chemotaxis protein
MIRILLIDDHATILENTAELLDLEGYETITSSNGKEGLEKVIRMLPDVLLCDIPMPKMDGFTVLKRMGEHPDLKRIPFIFYSSKSEKSILNWGLIPVQTITLQNRMN